MKGQLTLQNYKSYTKEDLKKWSLGFENEVQLIKGDENITPPFWEAVKKLKIKRGEIPNFENLNKVLKAATNFEVVATTGVLDEKIYYQLIKSRKFPLVCAVDGEPPLFIAIFSVPYLMDKTLCDTIVKNAELILAGGDAVFNM